MDVYIWKPSELGWTDILSVNVIGKQPDKNSFDKTPCLFAKSLTIKVVYCRHAQMSINTSCFLSIEGPCNYTSL